MRKVSSLHDDSILPFHLRYASEYSSGRDKKGRLNRHETLGRLGVDSVIQRIRQFGITDGDLAAQGVRSLSKITKKQYGWLVSEAMEGQYCVAFASIYIEWGGIEKRLSLAKRDARSYHKWGLRIIKSQEDIDKKRANIVLALEGADCVKSLSDVQSLFHFGVRCACPQYGQDNYLAHEDGLTVLGKRAVKMMFELGMIVDLAHSTPLVRQDIFAIAEDMGCGNQLAYTHGSQVEDMLAVPLFSQNAERRCLTEEEVDRIIRLGGIIGLGVSMPFFKTLDDLASRIDAICQKSGGSSSLGIGSDFGGVSPGWLIGINNPRDFVKIGDILSGRFGYSDAAIDAILRDNVMTWLKEALIIKPA